MDDGTVKLKINGVDVGPLTHIDRTLAVTSEQIKKAKTLIYVTSAITGFCARSFNPILRGFVCAVIPENY